MVANHVLCQLSYTPLTARVGLDRFELSTSPLSGVRSNQLSYRPAGLLPQKKGYRFYTVASTGFAAPCLQCIFEDQENDLSKLDRRKLAIRSVELARICNRASHRRAAQIAVPLERR